MLHYCKCSIATLLCSIAGTAIAQPDIYVDADATGADDGSSWTDAYTDFQDALDDTSVGASTDYEIWVAEGTYIRSGGSSRDGFEIPGGSISKEIDIFGGFDGTETDIDDRAGLFSTTILSGDRGTTGVKTDNSYHVVETLISGTAVTVELNGFTVQDGYADGSGGDADGAGIYTRGSFIVRDCTISDNEADDTGGGMHVTSSGPGAAIIRSTIEDNTAVDGGGVFASSGAGVTFYTSIIQNNEATDGGGAYLKDSNHRVWNCLFAGNSATSEGGGIYIDTTDQYVDGPKNPEGAGDDFHEIRLHQNTLADNTATTDGGGIYLTSSSGAAANSFLANCTIWGNSSTNGADQIGGGDSFATAVYNNVEGGLTGTGNIDSDPLFQNASAGNYRLKPASPSSDVGDLTTYEEDPYDLDADSNTTEVSFYDAGDLDDDSQPFEPVPFDVGGTNRLLDTDPDMGAFECCLADCNLNGYLDSGDYAAWLAAYGASDADVADINRDGNLTGADFTAWVAAYDNGDGCD